MYFVTMSIDWHSLWQLEWVRVLTYASITALTTGLGAIPLLFSKRVPKRWLSLGNAVAAGLMLAASFRLIHEGSQLSLWRVELGLLLGVVLIWMSRRWLSNSDSEETNVAGLQGAKAVKVLLILGVMTLHSAAEGVGIGVSFGDGEEFGVFISLALAVHNIPEGLAISLVLVPKGVSVLRAGGWSVFTSLPQPLIALPAFFFVEAFEPFLPVGLGLAGGAMIWMVVSELLPEAQEDAPAAQVGLVAALSLGAMLAFQTLVAA
ncbi:MAG: ZIP family metal transporter [Bacteroidota bacterium]